VIFTNARFATFDGWFEVEGGRITALGSDVQLDRRCRPDGRPPERADTGGRAVAADTSCRAAHTTDLGGRLVLPGFVDSHCHGGGGAAIYSGRAEDVVTAARAHLLRGTTSLVASVATMRLQLMVDAARAIVDAAPPNVRMIHFEGPFLSPQKRGAQTEAALTLPDERVVEQLVAAAGGMRVCMTVAPELPGAIDLIERHRDQISFAIGHTDDDGTWTRRAIDAGARTATHLFNAMRPMTHREPGPVGIALTDDRIGCELIADGIHLSQEALTVAIRAAGDRAMLVTDAMAATGLGDGDYRFADREVTVRGNRATLKGTGTLAGSVHFLADTLKNFTLDEASRLTAGHAARHYGWTDRGTIAAGKVADFVVLDDELTVESVYLAGELVS
jgi:N-acetylglucosamine-6-phosphate deacetylase